MIKRNIKIITRFLLLIVAVPAGLYSQEKCIKDIKPSDTAGLLIGIGEGSSYVDAKNTALADAVAILGTKIVARSNIVESGAAGNVYTDRSVESVTDALVKGAKVLSTCQEGILYKATIGIPKSLIAQLITAHSDQRIEWVKRVIAALSTPPTPAAVKQHREGYAKALSDEKEDLESWLVLGRPQELFKGIPDNLKQEIEQKLSLASKPTVKNITIKAIDDIAKRTLPNIINRLAGEGVTATVDEGKGAKTALWQCDMTKGLPIGQALRFEVTCLLTQAGYELPPISAQGISVEANLRDQAVRLISQSLQAH